MNWDIQEWLRCARRAFTGRYVRLLEDELARSTEETARLRAEVDRERADTERERTEIARLRLENRAMLNSLLGTAGVPPVEEPRPALQPILAVRRRSWPQIAASRESQAARRFGALPNPRKRTGGPTTLG